MRSKCILQGGIILAAICLLTTAVYSAPDGWTTQTYETIDIPIPTDWKPMPNAPADIVGWYGDESQDVLIAVVRGDLLANELGAILAKPGKEITVGGRAALLRTPDDDDRSMAWVITFKEPLADGKAVAIFMGAPRDQWSKWEPVFTKVRNGIAFTGADAGGGTATPKAEVIAIFNNMNTGGVFSKPSKATRWKMDQDWKVVSIMTYHWNDGKGTPTPGTIGLKLSKGALFGPWQAKGADGQGGVPNAVWTITPNLNVPAGEYTIVDSDPESWSRNDESGSAGMCVVMGYYEKFVPKPRKTDPDQEVTNPPDNTKPTDTTTATPSALPTVTATAELTATADKVDAALKAGDAAAASELVDPGTRDYYEQVLASPDADLKRLAAVLATRRLVYQDEYVAQYEVTDQGKRFFVTYTNINGTWYLSSF